MNKSFKEVYQFKIMLKDIHPPVWRRIQVPETYTFWDLHVAIQDAMGWLDYHLHEFQALNPRNGKSESIGIPEDEPGEIEIIAGWERKLSDYFNPDNSKASYLYDFGDGWEHEIKLEKIMPREKNRSYPLCLDGQRACPPEDCGGVSGYQDLLEILANPRHKKYQQTLEWLGDEFNPEHFNQAEVAFEDPGQRLSELLQKEDDEDEWMDDEEDDESEDVYGPLKKLNRQVLYSIWEKAKKGDLEALDPENRQLGRIMQEHADEFFNAFEFADVTHTHEYDPENEMNPFLHITIHAAVENQLADKEPVEAYQFYNAMRQKKFPHHDTLHLLGAILTPFLFDCLVQRRPFDVEAYRQLLKKYKNKNPESILDLIEREETP
jgi:hypothetical protein